MASIHSDWVIKEINTSLNLFKEGLAIRPWNYTGNIPTIIQDNFEIVGFNVPTIIHRIEERLN
jgi:hypothetical protein